MTDRLVVDTAALRETAGALTLLHKELDGIQHLTEAARADLADDALADALDDFATNWRYHRGRITASIERMAGISTALADSLDEVERALAAAARGESSGTRSRPDSGRSASR